jgi:hypothetical protein
MECEFPDGLGDKVMVGDLFEWGILLSTEWSTLRYRISRQDDNNGKAYAYIDDGSASPSSPFKLANR